MSMSPCALAAGVLALAAGPALAAGYEAPAAASVVVPAVAPPAPVAVPGDWAGGYAGARLSFGSAEVDGLDDEYDGTLYGLGAGYRMDFGRIVAGGEVSYDRTDIDVEGVDVDDVLRAGVQVGYDAGRVLPYVTGGYARASLSAGGEDEDYDGGYLGAGVAYAVTERIEVGGEVLRHRFDVEGTDADVTTFGLRASYRF